MVVTKPESGDVIASVETLTLDDLPPGEVIVRVEFSSLNYKDALAYNGHPGIVGGFPHVPGVDCAGEVVASESADYKPADKVLITGYALGSGAWGAYSQYVRVPAEWVVAMPAGLTARTAMMYGTAGFTAAQCVDSLRRHEIMPESGPVIVTGATGGVGVLAVAILGKLGYEVTAVSGKPQWRDALRQLGAAQVVGRETLAEDKRPMLKSQWAGAVDTVGGASLTTLVKSTMYRGCVAACGLVAGDKLPLTVYPFLLRGVTLDGIDSAKCPRQPRMEMWRHLSGDWKVELPEDLIHEITLDDLPATVQRMMAGEHFGRSLVVPKSESV